MAHFYSVHDRLREKTELMDELDLFDFLVITSPPEEKRTAFDVRAIINRFDSAINGSINETGKDYDGFRFFITIHSGQFV